MSVKVITPISVTDAMLYSSSVAETDYAAWNAATSYTLGTKVIRTTTHRIYENLIAGVDAGLPESTPSRWLDIGPTNRWAMFDQVVGSATSGASPLTIVLRPGTVVGALSVLEITGNTINVSVKSSPTGSVIYDKTSSLDGTLVESFYDWFFADYEAIKSVVIADLPVGYTNPEIIITISGTGTVSCGVCVIGNAVDLGGALYGVNAGITDYSSKETDVFGRTSFVKRRYARRIEVKTIFDSVAMTRIYRSLSDIRSTPCVWMVSDRQQYQELTVYGIYKDFSIDVAYPTMSYCTLSLEGLI